MDSQLKSSSTMELYESSAEELCEMRHKYSTAIQKYLSEITERDIHRMKKMKYERTHAGLPRTKVNAEGEENYNFLGENVSKRNQSDDLRGEISQLREMLQKIKPEE